MAKITYLLGAGASANAMPVVAEMATATLITKRFFERLKNRINTSSSLQSYDDITPYITHIKKINRIIITLEAFKYILEDHSSVDTFFKRLFLSREDTFAAPTSEILSVFKTDELLSIYNLILIFCEFSTYQTKVDEYGISPYYNEGINSETEKLKLIKYINEKESQDKRYDSFFATIIKDNPLKLDENINIISWNYDIQLERSILRFIRKGSRLDDTYKIIKPNDNYFKVNGTIWPSRPNNSPYDFGDIGLDDCYIFPGQRFIPKYIQKFLESITEDNEYNVYNFNKNIFFQWNNEVEDTRKKAYKAVEETEVLVIIGYTFPNFNREVDRKIYRSIQNLKKIYIVDLNKDRAERIRTSIKSLLRNEENLDDEGIFVFKNALPNSGIDSYKYSQRRKYIRYVGNKDEENCKFYYTDIELITDANQFHIPAEF